MATTLTVLHPKGGVGYKEFRRGWPVRIRVLSDEVADIEPGARSNRVRRELLRFLEVAPPATSAPR